MNIVQLISLKRTGAELSQDQIHWMIREFAADRILPEQMSAMAMAILFRGMSFEETTWLTEAMINSGQPLKWNSAERPRLDKHSTGGIGDKISIPLAPLLAELGIDVPMISGRGLGPTGGTLDKLEAIPGFDVSLSTAEMQKVVRDIGCVIVSASAELAPADQKLYALRDITGTVPAIGLITSSILSKKLSEGIDALVMDVKWGSGAFMKTVPEAKALAERIVFVANRLGVVTRALITDMNQPLGRMIGNACEIAESIEILQGSGPADVRQLTLDLATHALLLTKLESDTESARQQATKTLDSGAAYERFEKMVTAQKGRLDQLDSSFQRTPVDAGQAGYVSGFDAEKLGYAIIEMGGGRKQPQDKLNLQTGLESLVRIGDPVEAGQPWVNLLNVGNQASPYVLQLLSEAIEISDQPPVAPCQSLVSEVVDDQETEEK